MIVKNINRHRVKSILSVLISLLIVLFLFIYLGGLAENMEEFSILSDTLPVEGKITNITGSKDNDLNISAAKVQQLERTEMLRDVKKITTYHIDETLSQYNEEELRKQIFDTMMFSTNVIEALPYVKEINLSDGHSVDFLGQQEAFCILEKKYMTEQGLNLGDEYEASIYRKKWDMWLVSYEHVFVNTVHMKIIGTYEIDAQEARGITTPHVITPIQYVREAFREVDAAYSVHSMKFTLSDALKMNEFKEKAAEIGFASRDPQGGNDNIGAAIVTYDESFIKTAEQLQKNISLMQIFAPIIFIIVAFIGFLTSYLLLQSRQNEFAIMRSLGQSKASVFLSLLIEAMILALIGGLIGSVIGIIIGTDLLTALVILGIFIILYSLGTVIALLFLSRFSVMEVLTKADE